jgi:hypothetical protein
MTEQDWERVEKELSAPLGRISLQCDEYLVTLRIVMTKPLKFAILPFVNGEFNAGWSFRECEERRRFECRTEKYLYKSQQRAAFKRFNRQAQKAGCSDLRFPDVDKKHSSYTPFWTDFKKLKRHLIANNSIINLILEATKGGENNGITQEN